MHEGEWAELESLLTQMRGHNLLASRSTLPGERAAALYRRACEHLALARARSYPAYLIDRLEQLTSAAHQLIYQRREFGVGRVKWMLLIDFPRAVRAHGRYVTVAAVTFALPTIVLGLLVYMRPELILSVVSSETAAEFEAMYSASAESIGRRRDANTDWVMFAYYIRNNISVSFQCFAAGLFVGLGTLFFLAYNGAFAGALAGFLTERGLSETFYSFVATHSSFELTAIVLSGAAGLRLGHSLLAPGRRTRAQALLIAARESAVLLYGVVAMLLIAAAVEAFWSSARWLPSIVKYGVAAVCWTFVVAYLAFQGRRAR
jgi:uncharacterized membrane protein SpoIIM required for sporulation